MAGWIIALACVACGTVLAGEPQATAEAGPSGEAPLSASFDCAVAPALHPSQNDIAAYAVMLQQALDRAQAPAASPQFVAVVDRNPNVQAVLIYWGSSQVAWRLVGAAPVSTGLPGRFEHFTTPLGVFEHSLANPDFRAEGTKNQFGIRGYGRKGSRVYDFGWVAWPKGWGDGAMSVMRLQMHSTDPDVLEQRLGTAQSKGCIRIPASLNEFIDRYGVLDGAYEEELASGARLWVLREDREPTPWSGRYLVVVDSERSQRPGWAVLPASPAR